MNTNESSSSGSDGAVDENASLLANADSITSHVVPPTTSSNGTKTTNGYGALSNGGDVKSKDLTDDIVESGEVGDEVLNGEIEDGRRGGGDGAAERGDGADGGPLMEGNKEMRKRMGILFPAVALGVLLGAADQTIVVSSYGMIGSDLNALNNTSWIATAYFLTLTCFQPLYGKLSDIFGRKSCLLFAYTVFGVGCLFCGLARNLNELVAARALAGIGGGGMNVVVSILMSDIIPLRERGNWQGYINIVFATGASLGAPLGGLLADSIGWRWSFIGQFPLTIIASLTVYFVLELPVPPSENWVSKLRQIDFMGAFTLILAVSSMCIGLDLGSNTSWSSPSTLLFTISSIPLYILFIIIETKIATHPFAPGQIIFQRSLLASYMQNFFASAAVLGLLFYIPLYFQAVEGMSAMQAGLRLIPVMLCSVSGSLTGGKVMQRTGKYYWLTIWSICFSILGSVIVVCMSGLVLNTSTGITVGLCVVAYGGGIAITTTLLNILANTPASTQAIATACSYLFRSLGSVIGVSLASAVVQGVLRVQLAASLGSGDLANEIVEKVRQSLGYIETLDPETRELVRSCYGRATEVSFAMAGAFLVVGLAAAGWIREGKLSK